MTEFLIFCASVVLVIVGTAVLVAMSDKSRKFFVSFSCE